MWFGMIIHQIFNFSTPRPSFCSFSFVCNDTKRRKKSVYYTQNDQFLVAISNILDKKLAHLLSDGMGNNLSALPIGLSKKVESWKNPVGRKFYTSSGLKFSKN